MNVEVDQLNTLTRLTIDSEYYGDFGKQFLSNSDVGTLLKNPMSFGESRPDNPAFAFGRYFHQLILEPEKAQLVDFIDVASRNTKAYKEHIAEHGGVCLLKKEYDHVNTLVDRMRANIEFFDGLYQEGNKFEVPAVGKILGVDWKGKADIVCKDCLIDIKTTADIYKFKYSAYSYNYDSQCYIYQLLFGKPLKFYVIDKSTMLMGIFTPTEEFVDRGREKVFKAIHVYERFFGENAQEDVQDFFIQETL